MNTSNRPQHRDRRSGVQSTIAHALGDPRFVPATVVWFAALFGLGALAASADSLAALVIALHLPAVLPAAAPPLGLTAHCLVAFALTLAGALVGLAVAIVARGRLGRSAANAPVVAPGPRRRAVSEPDSAAPVLAQAEPDAPRVRSRDAHPDAPPRRPLVVTEHVLPFAAAPEPAAPEPAVPDFSGPLANPADLPPFLAAAYAATHAPAPATPGAAPPIPEPAETAEHKAEPEPAAAPLPLLATRAAAAPHVPITEAALGTLGLVQMIERLAIAIALRQALHQAPGAPGTAPDLCTPLHRFDPLTMDPAGPLLRTKPARPEPIAADFADFEAEPEPLAEPVEAIEAIEEEDHDAAIEGRYSSLAAMTMRRPELVAHPLPLDPQADPLAAADPAPAHDLVVPFPLIATRGAAVPAAIDAMAPEAAAPDADSALREALATLRRMSAQR